jgi:hypothetical protein
LRPQPPSRRRKTSILLLRSGTKNVRPLATQIERQMAGVL